MPTPPLIPLVDLAGPIQALRPELERRISALIERGEFVGGAAVSVFESAFAAYLGTPHCVGVASGTDALTLALRAAGVGPGDEVIVPAFSFVATAEAVLLAGAVPRFVDVEIDTALLSLGAVQAALSHRSRAVIAVHLYGRMMELEPLVTWCRDHGLRLVEDAAQAHGARRSGRAAGTVGDLGAFSFYPTKNLGGLGDGGAVVSADPGYARAVRLLANHGRNEEGRHERAGTNSRLDAIQAVALELRLQGLDVDNERRRQVALRYTDALADLPRLVLPVATGHESHVHHLFVVRTPERDLLAEHLGRAGIGTGVYYREPLHLMPAFRDLGYQAGAFPAAEQLAREVLALPMHPTLSRESQDRVIDAVRGFFLARGTEL